MHQQRRSRGAPAEINQNMDVNNTGSRTFRERINSFANILWGGKCIQHVCWLNGNNAMFVYEETPRGTFGQQAVKNLRAAEEVLFFSESVGKEVQALFSIAVDLQEPTEREGKPWRTTCDVIKRSKRIDIYLSFHLGDSVQRSLSFGQQDPGEGGSGLPTWDQEVERERRAGGEPRPGHIDVVFCIHPERVQLWDTKHQPKHLQQRPHVGVCRGASRKCSLVTRAGRSFSSSRAM